MTARPLDLEIERCEDAGEHALLGRVHGAIVLRGVSSDDRARALEGWTIIAAHEDAPKGTTQGSPPSVSKGRFGIRVERARASQLCVQVPDEWNLFPRAEPYFFSFAMGFGVTTSTDARSCAR